jgi:hypothetical protein
MSSKVEREEVIYMATKQEFVELIGRVFADDEFRTKLQSDPVGSWTPVNPKAAGTA